MCLQLRQKVFDVSGKEPSKKWVQQFLKAHLEINAKRPRPLDPKRARAFNPATVQVHCELLAEVIFKYEIPVENIYNTDEKGIQLRGGRKSSTTEWIFVATDQNHYILKGDSLLLITFIETVCANGTLCSPGVIMPPGAMREWYMVEGIGCFSQSANGWTDNLICHQWFEKAFIPCAKSRNISGKPILLISDGHQSHETPEMRTLAFDNCIILYSLPPKITHKLQSLDVGVFGTLQAAWTKHCETRAIQRNPITQYNVVSEYMQVWNLSLNFRSFFFLKFLLD
ncbi:hypothetical protein M422DRAFT_184412 [Sphaerobolus stellatus SS14]|uniref:DDE-1 domain-containing protein n=1 Tax=Sphaerobolus stellatus (strain SS14) TaxID=990650 RepID=A0A0C9UTF1_SPHS4|nr:hypothetical protein M422DRAFT_184412 [Sphaerobolus stellatus SS14]